jgi:hypothetical protein
MKMKRLHLMAGTYNKEDMNCNTAKVGNPGEKLAKTENSADSIMEKSITGRLPWVSAR